MWDVGNKSRGNSRSSILVDAAHCMLIIHPLWEVNHQKVFMLKQVSYLMMPHYPTKYVLVYVLRWDMLRSTLSWTSKLVSVINLDPSFNNSYSISTKTCQRMCRYALMLQCLG